MPKNVYLCIFKCIIDMKCVNRRIWAAMAVLLACVPLAAQQPIDVTLWRNGAPNDNGDAADVAMMRVFLPDKKTATGRAVVICPGGGYETLSMESEGYDWAPFFNNEGIAVIVLKYRMPHGNHEVPIADAEQAIQTVRLNASSWNINPKDVGIMGFSAGGHLASTLATHSEKNAKPDFQILFYPVITMMPDITHAGTRDNFLGSEPKKKDLREYSNDLQVTRVTPRAWIALCDDDHTVLPANGVNYYVELYRHDVPASLHVYPSGGHGWGYKSTFKYHLEMLMELKSWLKSF